MTNPLTGVRVLDLTQVLAGPFAGRLLADLGADVIKVEQPKVGEPSRGMGPYFLNGESYYYLGLNTNKRGITLNLQNDQGLNVFYDLVRHSDVVLENYRSSVPRRLHIDFESLRKINDRLIYCSISGLGHGAKNEDRPLMDANIQSLGGAMSIIGEEGQSPATMGFPVGDLAGSYAAVSGIVAALFDRERNGKGSYVDISLLDVMVSLQGYIGQAYLITNKEPGRIGSGHPTNTPVSAFKARDGLYLQVQCPHQRLYEMLTDAIVKNTHGFEDLPNDVRFATPDSRLRNRSELLEILSRAFVTRTAEDWLTRLANIIPISPINSIGQALQEPSIIQRNMTPEVEHPKAGKYRILGNPIKMGQEEVFKPAPGLGQHNDEVFSQVLGYSDEKIKTLKNIGAF